MYSAMDIAKYLVFKSNEEKYCLDPLQLQSILFFIQKCFIEIKGKPCFDEDIIAYEFGPVVLPVLKKFGVTTCAIYYPEQGFLEGEIGNSYYEKFDTNIIKSSDKEIIDTVLSALVECSCSTLSALLTVDPDYVKARKTSSKIILLKNEKGG